MKKQSSYSTLNRRKRPRQKRSTDTVETIIEAAARILESNGHEGFSTNSVAERAGVSIGSLYQYFPNKAAIMRALIEREANSFLEKIRSVSPGGDAKTMLDQLLEIAVQHQFRRPALAKLLDLEEERLPASKEFQSAGLETIKKFEQCLSMMNIRASHDLPVITRDVLSIIRAIKDSAGQMAGDSVATIIARVRRAVHGYLFSPI
jgi:AcrR family transcriptional regulator